MPGHKEIIAFSIDQQKVLWRNDYYNFLFVKDDKVYTFKQRFESRDFYTLDIMTGEMIEELGTDPVQINSMRENLYSADHYKNYYFPETLSSDSFDPVSYNFIQNYVDENVTGNIEYIRFGDLLLMNYHKKDTGFLTNSFYVLDINNRKLVMKEVLNHITKAVVPDSFFIKDDLLFLLKERQQLLVFRIS